MAYCGDCGSFFSHSGCFQCTQKIGEFNNIVNVSKMVPVVRMRTPVLVEVWEEHLHGY